MTVYNINPHVTGDTWNGISNISFTRNNSALDLTGSIVKMLVKSVYSIASPVILTLSTSNSGITISYPASSGMITIPPQIIDIPVGRYQYEIIYYLLSGEIKTFMAGVWDIN